MKGGSSGEPPFFPRVPFSPIAIARHDAPEARRRAMPDIVLLEIAGHTSVKMLRHYAHIRMDAKRKALDSISTTVEAAAQAEASHVTNHVTPPEKATEENGEVIDSNGAGYWIRTSDPLRVRQMLYR
jgi:hypothetical protein